jgi:TolB protein
MRIGLGLVLVCLVLVLIAGAVLVRYVPRVAWLVHGRPASATPLATLPVRQLQWIAFETERGEFGDYEVYAVATDGSRLTNLTNSWADDVAPVWSPDGRHVAFVSYRHTLSGKWSLRGGSIYVLDFDPQGGVGGGNPRRLTFGASDDWPTWSPDGQRIAFQSDRSGNWDIWCIKLDGSGLTRLTDDPGADRYPDWSPDGQKIAFTSKRGGNEDVWVQDVTEILRGAGGSAPVNLTRAESRDRYAMWSPDGERLTFNTERDGNLEIYMMNADGSNPRNVSRAPESTEGLADWSPDGNSLVLYSDCTGNKEVFIVDLLTGKWTNLTNHPASDEFATWSP